MDSLLLGKSAPHFTAQAIVHGKKVNDFSLEQMRGKYVLFFFYPLNFSFVCPTELHAFQEKIGEFEKRGAHVVGCSVDSAFAHAAWLSTPKTKGGIEGVTYPLVSDLNKTISRDFHVLNEKEGIAYRGQFLIDKQGIVRHQLISDLSIGRSVDEALRILDALIFNETHGEFCPANWKQGAKSMKPSVEGLMTYFNDTSEVR